MDQRQADHVLASPVQGISEEVMADLGSTNMMSDLEIADLLDGISRKQMDAAIAAINGYGFDISAPWECDQDDREYEQFCGLLNAIRAALAETQG